MKCFLIIIIGAVLLLTGCGTSPEHSITSGGNATETTTTTATVSTTTTAAPAIPAVVWRPTEEEELALLRRARESAAAVTGCRYTLDCRIQGVVALLGSRITIAANTEGTYYADDTGCKTHTVMKSGGLGISRRTENYHTAAGDKVIRIQDEGKGWWGGETSMTTEQLRKNSNLAFLLLAHSGEPLSVRAAAHSGEPLSVQAVQGEETEPCRLEITFPATAWETLLSTVELPSFTYGQEQITAALRNLGPAVAEIVIDRETGVAVSLAADLSAPLRNLIDEIDIPFGLDGALTLISAKLTLEIADYNDVEDFSIPDI